MKILIIIISLSIGALSVKAQSVTGNARVMSPQEANALNGTPHPTINGIPYEQYKAEQQNIKKTTPVNPMSVKGTSGNALNKNASKPVEIVAKPQAPAQNAVTITKKPEAEKNKISPSLKAEKKD